MEVTNLIFGNTYEGLIEGQPSEDFNRSLYASLIELRFPKRELILNEEEKEIANSRSRSVFSMTIKREDHCIRYIPSDEEFKSLLPKHFYLLQLQGPPKMDEFTFSTLDLFWLSDIHVSELQNLLIEIDAKVNLRGSARDVNL